MDPITNPTMPPAEKKSMGAVASIIVIIVLLIAGAIYFWMNTSKNLQYKPVNQSATQGDVVTSKLETQSSSDELDAINKDLADTNIDAIDADFQTDTNL